MPANPCGWCFRLARYTRVSIGLEEPEDLIADFKQAIERCG